VKTRSDDSFRLNVKTALPRQAQDKTMRSFLATAEIRRRWPTETPMMEHDLSVSPVRTPAALSVSFRSFMLPRACPEPALSNSGSRLKRKN
jgi:hypothetical protein